MSSGTKRTWKGRDLYEELRRAKGAGLAVVLARINEREHELVLRVSGMSADEAGLRVLVEEIGRTYEARLSGAAREDEPMQYADVAEWQNKSTRGVEAQSRRDFFGASRTRLCTLDEATFQRSLTAF